MSNNTELKFEPVADTATGRVWTVVVDGKTNYLITQGSIAPSEENWFMYRVHVPTLLSGGVHICMHRNALPFEVPRYATEGEHRHHIRTTGRDLMALEGVLKAHGAMGEADAFKLRLGDRSYAIRGELPSLDSIHIPGIDD